eukprot:scaffold155787_cov29-Tisochrysis_lutea.AAC.11
MEGRGASQHCIRRTASETCRLATTLGKCSSMADDALKAHKPLPRQGNKDRQSFLTVEESFVGMEGGLDDLGILIPHCQ